MTDETTYNFSVLQFSAEDFWRETAGETEFTRRVNKEGESGWEFVRIVWHSDDNNSDFVAVLRRPNDWMDI